MKKLLLIISLFSLALVSCQKEEIDEIFDQSPEERVNEQLSAVRSELLSNEMGWLSTYVFAEGKEELVLQIKFLNESRAEIIIPQWGGFKMESSYTLRYTQQVDLVFDTHSFLAALVDAGYKADFRWELEKQEDGKFFFNSRAQSNEGESTLVMEKTTPENLAFALRGQELKSYMRPDYSKSYFRALELATGERYDYSFEVNKVIFESLENGEIVRFESEITLTESGFVLNTPFVVNGKSIVEFKCDEATGNFTIVNAEGVEGGIYFVNNPVLYTQDYLKFGDSVKDLRFIPGYTLDSSSDAFQSFFTNLQDQLIEAGYKLTSFRIEWGFAGKYNVLWMKVNGEEEYCLFDTVQEDGRIVFKLLGVGIEDENLFNGLLPFLQLFFSENGFYVQYTGTFMQYINPTYFMISSDAPSMGIYFIDWM